MALTGFGRLPSRRSEDKILLRFRHSLFKSDDIPPIDLYKRIISSSREAKIRGERSVKSIPIASSQLIQSLVRKSLKEMKMTNVEFSRLLSNFHLESAKKTFKGGNEINITECVVEQPEYLKGDDEQKIAGFYGNISTEQLKKAMGKYLPVLDEVTATEFDVIEQVIEVETDGEPKSKKMKKKKSDDEMSIIQTPKRKYKKRARKIILPRETQQATDFLLMENADFEREKNQILECFAELNVEN
jgi:hypothetical protein